MKREPQIATRQEDIKKMYEIRDHVKHEMKLNGDVVENDASKYVVFILNQLILYMILYFNTPLILTLFTAWCSVS